MHFTYSLRRPEYDAYRPAKPMNPNHRFLVVDDFAPMREIIRKVLQELGYEHIQEANDGATALPMLQSAHFDMLITDWNMPKLAGIDLLRAVRADAKTKHLPVLIVTAEVKREQIIAATQAGVNGYIIKPFTPQALAEKVRKILIGPESRAS
jgi:two-component system chemotaxis response regulator CheY